jgi:hypothetical protein
MIFKNRIWVHPGLPQPVGAPEDSFIDEIARLGAI